MTIAIAGATGFIGKNLIQEILDTTDHWVVALSRSEMTSSNDRLSARKVNLYSLLECEKALEAVDTAVYLVHSMSPSARLAQGSFEDFDFILADNFAKAAVKCGVKHIIYVGGIIPEGESLSEHLRSRLEVEAVFRSHETPVTTLRCGLVIGTQGSSFRILDRLIERLPVLALPTWTRNRLQVVYIKDLTKILKGVIGGGAELSGSFDVGAPEKLEYRDLLAATAKIKKKNNVFFPIRFVTTGLSKLWVRLITGVSKNLVYPLVDSLLHKMTVDPKRVLPSQVQVHYTDLEKALSQTLFDDQEPELGLKKISSQEKENYSLVQSVQRLPCPEKWSMKDVALHYASWLPDFMWPFFKVKRVEDRLEFKVIFLKSPLLVLELSRERTFPGRELYYITGGLLNTPHNKARIEFREGVDRLYLIVAIHFFRPRLPWYVYKFTQAQIHRFVMFMFGRELGRQARQGQERPSEFKP